MLLGISPHITLLKNPRPLGLGSVKEIKEERDILQNFLDVKVKPHLNTHEYLELVERINGLVIKSMLCSFLAGGLDDDRE